MRPTLQDVAKQAGVSLATVDRVLNRRPGVRKTTINKVETAISVLGYIRDVSAANLSKRLVYRFAFVIPEGTNSFMRALEAEIEAARQYSATERTEISIYKVPPFDGPALAAALDGLNPERFSGVAVVAADATSVRGALARLNQSDVPVVTLVSDVPSFKSYAYVGIDNVAAGRTAARLMGKFIGGKTGKIALVAGSMLLRDHVERRMGFEQVMHSDYPDLECLPVIEGRDDGDIVEEQLSKCLTTHPDVIGVYNMGAGNRGIIHVVSARPRKEQVVIAHELTPHTREALRNGVVDAIIHQDPGHEVRSALRILKSAIENTPLLAGQETIRLEIYLNENLP
ncbi:LacI family transcriptional regulator [Cohaesibacter sp. ES.047]|uniref:LacI family DNA-binding transcriptional regulator n=1 Tax=Cohaesibacter sp. ES.047 TaxID=1798205 RepID=UPI000BB7712F|nr:LacI family DNA-binding transcriptional regulator [Cohaesibacter sp. ES.047]SNY92296.1 LacI family transcriptional regulator [Cohaesibacter sp. ES.047]